MSASKFWDKQAAKYARSAIRDMAAYETGLRHATEHLKADMQVMEFGAGTGMTALRLAPHVKHYHATDISPAMIKECEKRNETARVANITFQATQLDDPSFENAGYDAVLGFNILHLIQDIDTALQDIHRMLKPGGLLITKSPCQPMGFNPKFRAMLALGRVIRLVNPGLFFRIDKIADLDARFEASGFQIIETGCFPKDPPGRFVVARKV